MKNLSSAAVVIGAFMVNEGKVLYYLYLFSFYFQVFDEACDVFRRYLICCWKDL